MLNSRSELARINAILEAGVEQAASANQEADGQAAECNKQKGQQRQKQQQHRFDLCTSRDVVLIIIVIIM